MKKEMMILGENCAFSLDSHETGLNNNVLVVGGSGSGKTYSVVEPALLNSSASSVVVTVTKRRIVDRYRPALEKQGYITREINFAFPAKSDVSYDPLAYLHSYSDISDLAQAIMNANPRKEKSHADPYWDEAASSLLAAEIAYVMSTKKDATFADVLEFNERLDLREAESGIVTTLDDDFEKLGKADPKNFAVNCWKTFRALPRTTAGCVFSVMNTTLDKLFTDDIRRMIAKKPSVDVLQMGRERTALFVVTSAVNPSLNMLISLFYAQVFKSLFEHAEKLENGCLEVPVRIICDDFATGGRIPDFQDYISVFREKGMSVMLLLQSESQLISLYGENEATTIINNCDTYVYMGGMDLHTAKSVGERLNAPLDEVLWMPVGREIVFRRGQKPVRTMRYHILEDEKYKRLDTNKEKKRR